MDYIKVKPEQEISETGLVYDLGSLYDYLSKIQDPRKAKGKQYLLVTLLVLILLAKLSGEDQPSGIAEWIALRKDNWLEYRLVSKAKMPSHMTYRRVFQKIVSVEELEQIMQKFHQEQLEKGQEVVFSVDGKTVRGTIPHGECRGTHLLAIYVPSQGLVLTEAEVDRKENEIVVAPHLLRQVPLEGAIVVADAMHTQKEFCNQVVEGGGDYILKAKGNQPRLEWAIEKLFVSEVCNLKKGVPLSKDFQMAVKTEKGHGRIEKRTILTSSLLNDYLDWPYLAQVFRIEKIIWYDQGSRYTREVSYGLTSLSSKRADPEKLLGFSREYWGIESGLHYRRDVTFHEDATRLTVGDSGHVMAIINNLAHGLCSSAGLKNTASARRRLAANPDEALSLLTARKIPTL
jgi:predicted transposase YbfD/YdcC